MAQRPSGGPRRPKHDTGHDSPRRRALRAGLSILALDQEGSGGDANLRDQAGDLGTPAPVRDGDGDGSYGSGRHDHNLSDPSDGGGLRSGDVGHGGDSEGSKAQGLPSLGQLDSAQLPYVADGHWGSTGKAVAQNSSDGVREGDVVLDNSVMLTRLTGKALRKIESILDIELDPDDEEFGTLLRAQLAGSQAILNSQIKVDEQQFRRQQEDRLPQLLKIILEEQAAQRMQRVT